MTAPAAPTSRWPIARPVAGFALAGLIAVVIVGFATAAASRRIGQREAISDARSTTLVKAQTIVQPVVTNGLVAGKPRAVAAVNRVVHTGVLDQSLVRVKIWTRGGKIVYSDKPALIGQTFQLGSEEINAIDNGVIQAEVSDLAKPENRFERSFRKLLEVYLPIRAPNGDRLLFEAYYRYDAVSQLGNTTWRSFAPVAIGSLVALELVQIPLAWSLARRLRDRQRDREHLLQRAIDASDSERRRIARDLHDSVVQDLAGVAYSLAGASRADDGSAKSSTLLEQAGERVRDSIRSLRSLIVDIYPPNLDDAGLSSALADLLASAEQRGVRTQLDADQLPTTLPPAASRVLWRVAQEGVRNAVSHARASRISIAASRQGEHITLDIADDGAGFDPETLPARADEGHVGLRGLNDLVGEAGGILQVDSRPGTGTHLRVEVPLR